MTSLADALTNTGMIPAAQASQLQPNAPTNTDKPKPPEGGAMAQYAADEEKTNTARKERDAAALETPKFPTLAPAPKPDTSNDALKGYTSAIGVLGAVGSMFTRSPMTNSMNAAAAALNSMKEGDQAAFKAKFDEWKNQNDNAFKLLDYENKIYDTVLKNKTASVDERISEMQAHAAMFKDDYMMQLAKDRNIVDMEDLQLRRQEAAVKAQEASSKIQDAEEKRGIYQQWQRENPNAPADQKAAAHARIFDPSVAAAEVRKTASANKEFEKNKQNYEEAVSQIDDLIDMVDKGGGFGVTGLAGMAQRGKEIVETAVPVGKNLATPANDFQSKVETLKLELPKKLTGTSKSAADERKEVANIIGGLGAGQTQDITRNKLIQLKQIFEKRAKRDEPYDTQNYKIGDTVMSPDGRRMKITGFDEEDGTPLGEPVK